MIVDTHTHIYLNKKSKTQDIINNLEKDNIEKIVSIWIDIESSKKSISLSKNNPGKIYASVWIHPCYTYKEKENIDNNIKIIEELILKNKNEVKAVWECWFDFYRLNEKNRDDEIKIQKKYFIKQIELANKYNLPIIIHSRNAKNETFDILKEYKAKKVLFHCYCEDLDFAYKIIDQFKECMISFSWIVTYPSATEVKKTAANININNILIETDTPYLAPKEVRWQENVPNNIKYTLQEIYKLRSENWKKESFEELRNKIYKNSIEFLNLK